jgi:hypothetical protein
MCAGLRPPRVPAPRRHLHISAAKKGGGGNKKGGSAIGSLLKPKEPYQQTAVIMHNLLLIESHVRKTRRPIFGDAEIEISEAAKALFEAPFAVLAHDGSSPEPKFVYANRAALALFEATWDELVGTPSSASAAPVEDIQADRSAVLAAAAENGCVEGYEGPRVSLKGRRFSIKGATLFNVEAPNGDRVGQAVVIPEWEYEDGIRGGVGVVQAAVAGVAGGAAPTAEDVVAAEAAVVEQSAVVRELKEGRGLGNGSEEVQAAVAELLRRKEAVVALRAAVAAAEAAAAAAAAAEADG